MGLRVIERLFGVNHNSVMNWVLQAVEGKMLKSIESDEVQWVEADELWRYVEKSPCWLWWAIVRVTKKVCEWRLVDHETQTTRNQNIFSRTREGTMKMMINPGFIHINKAFLLIFSMASRRVL